LKQRIPIYVAGISPKLLELAGKVGDCAMLSPALATVEATRRMYSCVKAGKRPNANRQHWLCDFCIFTKKLNYLVKSGNLFVGCQKFSDPINLPSFLSDIEKLIENIAKT
jgi:hypothetical protein